jgi:hypothetical protein
MLNYALNSLIPHGGIRFQPIRRAVINYRIGVVSEYTPTE